jgi:two-component system nitrate/nitrite response regulator NarL
MMPKTNNQTQGRRIGLVEDDRMIRTYLAALLQSQAEVGSVTVWESAEDFATSSERNELDILLVDLDLPGEDGISLIRRMHQKQPELSFIVLTSSSDPRDVFAAMRAGASGYLVKDASPDELLGSIRSVIQDGVILSPVIAKLLVDEFLTMGGGSRIGKQGRSSGMKSLTDREFEVLKLISKHGSAKETAAALGLSHETVRVHMKKVYQKLHVASKAGALAVLAQSQSNGVAL